MDTIDKQLKRRANILYRLRRKCFRAHTKDRIVFYHYGKDPLAVLQIRQLTKEFNFNIQFEL